jgi:hypothetical protein
LWPQPPPPTLSEPIGVADDGDGVQAHSLQPDVGAGQEVSDADELPDAVDAKADPETKAEPNAEPEAESEPKTAKEKR